MKREILSEVNRFREIMGLDLLSEGPIPKALIDDLAKAFGRTEDQLFSSLEKKEVSALNRVFDDVADATGKSADDLIQSFKAGTLDDVAEDMFVAKLIQSGTDSLKQAAIKTYAKTKPELVSFVDQVIGDMAGKIKNLNDTQYADNIAEVSKFIDDANMTQEMKDFLKNQYKTEANKIRLSSRINYADDVASTIAGKTFDDLYTIYSAKITKAGKKSMTKDELIKLATAVESDFAGKPQDLINYLVDASKDKVAMGNRLKQIFGVTEEIVGGTGQVAAKGSEMAAKIAGQWGWKKLMMVLAIGGIGLAYFNRNNIKDWYYKSGGVRKSFLSKFGDAFTDLPEPLQKKLELNYNPNDFNSTANNAFLKSMDFNNQEDSETDSSVLTIRFNDGTFDKYSNSVEDREKWTLDPSSTHTKEEGTGSQLTSTSGPTEDDIKKAIVAQGYKAPITLTYDSSTKKGTYKDDEGTTGDVVVDASNNIIVT
jgi:hypothetical protein